MNKVKLLNNLFEITESSANSSGFITTIKLFAGHIVYAGHFPGYPVTPGVIQLQIVHELLEHHFGKHIRLVTVDDCKFLKIVSPKEERQIQISVEFVANETILNVKAAGKHDSDIFFKLKGTYRLVEA